MFKSLAVIPALLLAGAAIAQQQPTPEQMRQIQEMMQQHQRSQGGVSGNAAGAPNGMALRPSADERADYGAFTSDVVGRVVASLSDMGVEHARDGGELPTTEAESVIRSHGFDSEGEWRWAFTNTLAGYVYATLSPEERAQMEEAKRQLQSMPQMAAAMGPMLMGNAQHADAVAPYLDTLRRLFGERE